MIEIPVSLVVLVPKVWSYNWTKDNTHSMIFRLLTLLVGVLLRSISNRILGCFDSIAVEQFTCSNFSNSGNESIWVLTLAPFLELLPISLLEPHKTLTWVVCSKETNKTPYVCDEIIKKCPSTSSIIVCDI